MRRTVQCAIIAISILIGSPVTASVIVDTGPGPNVTSGAVLDSTQYLAGEFVINSAETIRSVFGWIGGDAGQTINIRLYSDGGEVPGSLLDNGSFVTSSGTSWQGSSSLDWTVQPGDYWISFEGTALIAQYMPWPAPNPLEHYAFFEDVNGAWLPDDGLKLGIFISTDSSLPPPVPEPSTWTTMLVGFGVIGALMRRKRVVTTHLASP